MSKHPISVYIICQNEQKHIERTLKAVQDFDEIIIVDSGSTDNTLEIAKKYTDKVFYKKWEGEGVQKAHALSLCSNEWVLNLDADEEVEEELKKELISFTQQDDYVALDIKFWEYSLGTQCSSLVRKNTHIRFFKKEFGSYKNLGVHAQISIQNGKIKQSEHCIHHFSDKFIHELVVKNNNYSTLRAEQKQNNGKKHSLLKLVFVFPLSFFKSYILRRSIFDGKKGFITSVINAFYAFLKEAKLYEKNHKGLR